MTFKKTQLLPALTNDLVIGRGGFAAYAPSVAWPGSRAGQPEARPAVRREPTRSQNRASRLLLRPELDTVGEQIAFGMLALAGLACLAQAFGTMAELAPNWELFNAWVARLLG